MLPPSHRLRNATTRQGGGLRTQLVTSAILSTCTFRNNTAASGGGAFLGRSGEGNPTSSSSAAVDGCTFENNRALLDLRRSTVESTGMGGGMWVCYLGVGYFGGGGGGAEAIAVWGAGGRGEGLPGLWGEMVSTDPVWRAAHRGDYYGSSSSSLTFCRATFRVTCLSRGPESPDPLSKCRAPSPCCLGLSAAGQWPTCVLHC